jgi:hypothetical protein
MQQTMHELIRHINATQMLGLMLAYNYILQQ